MFLHVGNNRNIRIRDVVGIFDTDNATVSSVTRKFLNMKQRASLVEAISTDIPKSFVLYLDNGEYKICFSPLSSASLRGRMNEQQ